MSWVSVFAGFLVAHMVGDYLLQTDWQARHKRGGLSDPAARRPLVTHVATYTLAFVPAFVWIGSELDVGWAVVAALLVFIPHLVVDDGRVVRALPRARQARRGLRRRRRLVGRPVLPRALALARGAAAGGRVNRRNRRLRAMLLVAPRWWSSSAPPWRSTSPTPCSASELSSVDERFKMRGTPAHADDVVIVAIDDKTFDDLEAAVALQAQASTRRSSAT